MAFHKCENINCQFEDFLNLQIDNDKYFTFFNNEECKCIFHLGEKQSSNKEIFLNILNQYIETNYQKNKNIYFEDVNFYFFEIDTNIEYELLSFKDVQFHCYPIFDALKCKELIINDCSFYKGGSFNEISISNLFFNVGLIERKLEFSIKEDKGYLENIKSFTNHFDGSGEIYFVGMDFKEANFKESRLNNVIFQNCNLEKVEFLNSNLNDTEFRNCIFPRIKDRKNLNEFNNDSSLPLILIFILSIFGILYMIMNNAFSIAIGIPLLLLFTLFVLLLLGDIFSKGTSFFNFYIDTAYHHCTYDEILIFEKIDKKTYNISYELVPKSLKSLSDLYNTLQKNFEEKGEIQKAGDFFYSKRYLEILSFQRNTIDKFILMFHFAVNGFGERFIRPLIWLIIIIAIGVLTLTPNTDFIATKSTPLYLLQDYNMTNNSMDIKKINITTLYTVELNKMQRLFAQVQKNNNSYSIVIPLLKDSSSIKNNNLFENRILFVSSRFISIVTPANKSWYTPKGRWGYTMSSFLSIISWFFIGAFILALRNRVRRK